MDGRRGMELSMAGLGCEWEQAAEAGAQAVAVLSEGGLSEGGLSGGVAPEGKMSER